MERGAWAVAARDAWWRVWLSFGLRYEILRMVQVG